MIATKNKIPIIKGLNPFQLVKQLNENMLAFLREKPAIYGPTFQCKLIHRKLIFTSDPEWVKGILQTNQKDFGRGRAYDELKLALGNGLLVNEGESWMRQRRLAQPAFYKQRLNSLFDIMEVRGNQMVSDLQAQSGNEISIIELFWSVTSDIVIQSLLGGESSEENKSMQDAIQEIQEYLVERIRSPLTKPMSFINGKHTRFKKQLKQFDDWVYRFIERQRLEGKDDNNLLAMLMDAKDEDSGETMSTKQLRDEMITIYVAGHETSTFALSWTLYLLTCHPEIYAKAKAEVKQIKDIENIGFQGIYTLTYLNQILMESMRIYPPAFVFGRRVLQDTVIDDTLLKKDDNIVVNVYGLHNDPNIWPNPDEFNPERFTAEAIKSRDKNAYIPFGGGPRMCIGNNFAIMEITMILAKLLYHFDLELVNKEPIETEPLITLRPKQDIMMRISKSY
jgi:cytochrome P450